MVNVLELKAAIVKAGFTQKEVYEGIGLSKRQWEARCAERKFSTDEMYHITHYVGIDNPVPIFFADEVT